VRYDFILHSNRHFYWYSYSDIYLSLEAIESQYDNAEAILLEADATQSATVTTEPELATPHHSTPDNISPRFFPRSLTNSNETEGDEQIRLAKAHKANSQPAMVLTQKNIQSELHSLFLPFLSSETLSSNRLPGDSAEQQYVIGPELFSMADMDECSE
jgi:hypothetical protein